MARPSLLPEPFKSALLWAVPENADGLREEARKMLAWEDIADDEELKLDESQRRHLAESVTKSQRDLKETVWRTYKNVLLLGKGNDWKTVDLGLVHSSAAETLTALILGRLKEQGDIEDGLSPSFLVRNWSPAFTEWSTKSVRDACFASPQFPRLLNPDAIKVTISKGVEMGALAYVGKKPGGGYEPFLWGTAGGSLRATDVEISDDVFVITREVAEAYHAAQAKPPQPVPPLVGGTSKGPTPEPQIKGPTLPEPPDPEAYSRMVWEGDVPPQKWMNFYTKVLSRFATSPGLSVSIQVFVEPPTGVSAQHVEETKVALRELGLSDHVETEG